MVEASRELFRSVDEAAYEGFSGEELAQLEQLISKVIRNLSALEQAEKEMK